MVLMLCFVLNMKLFVNWKNILEWSCNMEDIRLEIDQIDHTVIKLLGSLWIC